MQIINHLSGIIPEKQPNAKQQLKKFEWLIPTLKSGYLTIYTTTIVACLIATSCNSPNSKPSTKTAKKEAVTQKTITKTELIAIPADDYQTDKDTANEVMDEKLIRFNGKLERYFSLKEFYSVLGKPDSSKLLSVVEPCTNIFEEPDGSIDPQAKYLYKNGSRFETSKGKVAIDEIKFKDGDFIEFGKLKLNKNTTLADLKKMFPNAAKRVYFMGVAEDAKLQVIELREDKDNVSDGHVNIFIKDGKLYSLEWWFPC